VIAATSDTVAFVAIEYSERNPVIFSHAVNVLVFEGFSYFAAVQSSIHLCWARRYSSTMKGDLRYTTTDCFETYPFPAITQSTEKIGEAYYSYRLQLANEKVIGMTNLYHLMHEGSEDHAICQLRSLHVEMDNAVAAAYGWSDLILDHGFHETKQGIRYTISEAARREVLQRLLKLNHERYAEEVKQGLHGKKKTATKKGAPKKTDKSKEVRKATKNATPMLNFGEDDE
jgi:hypothetical protein